MRVLVVAQLLGACGLAVGGTAGGLLAEQLTGSPATAGLPLAMLVLGSGVGAVAVTRVMSGHGRRVGLAAAAFRSWPLLLAGCGLLGGGNTAVMLARYAAADLASRRGGRSARWWPPPASARSPAPISWARPVLSPESSGCRPRPGCSCLLVPAAFRPEFPDDTRLHKRLLQAVRGPIQSSTRCQRQPHHRTNASR